MTRRSPSDRGAADPRPGRRSWSRRGIQTRVVLLAAVGMVAPMAFLGWAGWNAVQALERRFLDERARLAASLAGQLDGVVAAALETLQGISSAPHVDLEDGDPGPERAAVHEAHLRSLVLDTVFLVDQNRSTVWEEPAADTGVQTLAADLAAQVFERGRPVVTGVVGGQVRRVFFLVPLRNWRARIVGVAGGSLDPSSPRFRALLEPFRIGDTGSIDLLDERGIVIASSDSARQFILGEHRQIVAGLIRDRKPVAGACHDCHESDAVKGRVRELMVFAPLSVVPWGISVREPEAEVFAATAALRRQVLVAGPVLLGLALLFAWGAARSVRGPLAVLTRSAEQIAGGDLSGPIPPLGEDEIGRLGRSLDAMRLALKTSLETVERTNQQLEQRVEDRTRALMDLSAQLRERDEWRGRLLRKVITAQEEERKRIARELHDETSQTVTALAMALDTAARNPALLPDRLSEARTLALRALDELHRVLFDLRPSILDDLGLLSAIEWFATRHLAPLGVAVRCEFGGLDGRLPPELETALFRVVQEAIANIARHAAAETVLIQCDAREGRFTIEIEDDGRGFDPAEVTMPAASGRGLGLLGMRERVELFGGSVAIDSAPGRGARIVVSVPLTEARVA